MNALVAARIASVGAALIVGLVPANWSDDRVLSGVTVTTRSAPAPGCNLVDSQLQLIRRRIWLRWMALSSPRDLGHWKQRSRPDTDDARPVDYSRASQAAIWKRWETPVILRFRVCGSQGASDDPCVVSGSNASVAQRSGEWLVDNAAIEAVATSQLGPILDVCGQSNYEVEVRFGPFRDRAREQELALLSLRDPLAETRLLAVEALAALGPSGKAEIGELQRMAKHDASAAVRQAAEAALIQIQER